MNKENIEKLMLEQAYFNVAREYSTELADQCQKNIIGISRICSVTTINEHEGKYRLDLTPVVNKIIFNCYVSLTYHTYDVYKKVFNDVRYIMEKEDYNLAKIINKLLKIAVNLSFIYYNNKVIGDIVLLYNRDKGKYCKVDALAFELIIIEPLTYAYIKKIENDNSLNLIKQWYNVSYYNSYNTIYNPIYHENLTSYSKYRRKLEFINNIEKTNNNIDNELINRLINELDILHAIVKDLNNHTEVQIFMHTEDELSDIVPQTGFNAHVSSIIDIIDTKDAIQRVDKIIMNINVKIINYDLKKNIMRCEIMVTSYDKYFTGITSELIKLDMFISDLRDESILYTKCQCVRDKIYHILSDKFSYLDEISYIAEEISMGNEEELYTSENCSLYNKHRYEQYLYEHFRSYYQEIAAMKYTQEYINNMSN